jgi:hypothetical protein
LGYLWIYEHHTDRKVGEFFEDPCGVVTNAETICHLVEGRILKWKGLPPFSVEELPSCLRQEASHGWLKFKQGYAAYRIFRTTDGGPEAWLFTFDGYRIHLIEVFSLPLSVEVGPLLDQLGTPEMRLAHPLAAQLQRPLKRPDENLNEIIFARRGLALLLGYAPDTPARLVRVRGFGVMLAETYQELFVDLPPMRFFPE